MEAAVVAFERGHIFGPRGEDEERTCGTGVEAAALGLPVSADGRGLQVYQSQSLLESHVFDALLAFRDARRDEHVATIGCRKKPLALSPPEVGVFRRDAVGTAMEEHLVLLGLSQEEQVAKGAVAHAADGEAQGALEQVGVFAPHHVAERVVAEVALPVLQLAVAHEDVVVVVCR